MSGTKAKQPTDLSPSTVSHPAQPSEHQTPAVELSPNEAKEVTAEKERRPWHDRVLGRKRPSRWWNDAIDDVVDGVDYGESPLPWERRETWVGYLIGPGLHNFRKLCQMPFVRALNWPFLIAFDLGWYALRGLAIAVDDAVQRFNQVGPLAEHSQRLRRVREISMSDPARIKQAVQDVAVFGVPPGNHLLRQVAEYAGMHDNSDLDKPEVYREFIRCALSKPQFVELLHRALGEDEDERRA